MRETTIELAAAFEKLIELARQGHCHFRSAALVSTGSLTVPLLSKTSHGLSFGFETDIPAHQVLPCGIKCRKAWVAPFKTDHSISTPKQNLHKSMTIEPGMNTGMGRAKSWSIMGCVSLR